jgi:hypothetical protein
VPEQVEQPTGLTTEQMIELLSQPAAAEFAYQVTQTYEKVERAYDAALNVGTFTASAASTNTPTAR